MADRILQFNVERLQWCCRDAGISLEGLAQDAGISKSALEKIQAGKGVTYTQLSNIAKQFGRGVLFFLESGSVVEEQLRTPEFRTLTNHKPDLSPKLRQLIERADRHRRAYLELLDELGEEGPPRFNPPEVGRSNPAAAAATIRRWLGLDLGTHVSFDDFRAALERVGVLVFRSNGYAGQWQIPEGSPVVGFALQDDLHPIIVVRSEAVKARQSFTLMHELGHLVLHRTSWIDDIKDLDSNKREERDANAFAGNLLIPPEALALVDDDERPSSVSEYDVWLQEARKQTGASGEAILLRLISAGRLPREIYAQYKTWHSRNPRQASKGNRQYRHREPKHIFGDRYVRTVLQSLESGHISLTRASDFLDRLKVSDIRQLEKHYAGA